MLCELRKAAGLSKTQAARLCGVSDRSYARWESGERKVPDFAYEKLKEEISYGSSSQGNRE